MAEGGLVAGRDLALDLAAGRRRGELVELVEQARDGVGPSGSNSMAWFGPWPQEQEAELLGRDDLRDGVRRGAVPFEVDIFLPPMLRNS